MCGVLRSVSVQQGLLCNSTVDRWQHDGHKRSCHQQAVVFTRFFSLCLSIIVHTLAFTNTHTHKHLKKKWRNVDSSYLTWHLLPFSHSFAPRDAGQLSSFSSMQSLHNTTPAKKVMNHTTSVWFGKFATSSCVSSSTRTRLGLESLSAISFPNRYANFAQNFKWILT